MGTALLFGKVKIFVNFSGKNVYVLVYIVFFNRGLKPATGAFEGYEIIGAVS